MTKEKIKEKIDKLEEKRFMIETNLSVKIGKDEKRMEELEDKISKLKDQLLQ
jgi:uncharacterized Fe-S cluster-containing radical SAM superfamily protein